MSQFADESLISLTIKRLGNPMMQFTISIGENYTLLDLLSFITKIPGLELSGYIINNQYITVLNAMDKVLSFVKGGSIDITENSCFNPKNDLLKAYVILKVYRENLQHTANLLDVCPINQGEIGSWIGFGQGPTNVPAEDDNKSHNWLFITYKYHTIVYNVHCLFKCFNDNKTTILIPHLNKQCYGNPFLEKWYNTKSQTELYNHIILEDDDFVK